MQQERADDRRRIIDAALGLAATRGWRGLSLAEIAAAAGMRLAEVYGTFPSKQAIFEGFLADVDHAVLSGGTPDLAEEGAHDRLFEAVMRRFEAMAPHRPAVRAIIEDGRRDPLLALSGLGRFLHSMAATLEAAGIASDGLSGLLRAKGLGVVYLQTLRVWVDDDSPDASRTMAALDRNLRRAESFCNSLRCGPWRRCRSGLRPHPESPQESQSPTSSAGNGPQPSMV
jgi:AcrR family transcriptional regulator